MRIVKTLIEKCFEINDVVKVGETLCVIETSKQNQEKIIEALPQLQCKKCEYPDCKSYAISLIEKNEETNKCEPGGAEPEAHIKSILSTQSFNLPKQIKLLHIADIVRPVDCMSMIQTKGQISWTWPSMQSEQSKKNYYHKIDRLDRIKKEKELNRQKILEDKDMDEYIRYALEAESRKHQKIKKYE